MFKVIYFGFFIFLRTMVLADYIRYTTTGTIEYPIYTGEVGWMDDNTKIFKTLDFNYDTYYQRNDNLCLKTYEVCVGFSPVRIIHNNRVIKLKCNQDWKNTWYCADKIDN